MVGHSPMMEVVIRWAWSAVGADLAGQLTVGPFGVEQGGAQGTA